MSDLGTLQGIEFVNRYYFVADTASEVPSNFVIGLGQKLFVKETKTTYIGDGNTPFSSLVSDINTYAGIANGTVAGNDVGRQGVQVLLPQDFGVGSTAPVLALINGRCFGWTIRNNSSDRINTVISRPEHELVDIEVVWVNLGATTGNVNWRLYRCANNVADSPASNLVVIGPVTVPSLGQSQFQRSRIATALDMSTDMFTTLMLDRPKDSNDTLAADVSVVAVIITPVVNTSTSGSLIASQDATACWFNEPRLIAYNGSIYGSFVNRIGGVGIFKRAANGTMTETILHAALETDDHDAPCILVRSDGKLMTFYSKHSIDADGMYIRTSTNTEDISAWGAESVILNTDGNNIAYPKPVQIGANIYVFFRNNTDHNYVVSTDNGATWSAATAFIQYNIGWRGYVNMVQNGSRVDFITNDDNPNTSSNCNLYHFYFQGGNFYKTDGTLIGAIGTAITTAQMTKIYDYTTDGDAWGWDLQLDASGKPVVVFATFPGSSTASTADTNHHYWYARWTGTAWTATMFTTAGGWIPDRGSEYRYSGGIALLASNTSVVYTSRYLNGSQWEIERWITPDGGTTWTSTAVTRRSWEKQIRPVTPERHVAGLPEVFWMSGWYTQFTVFGTRMLYRP